MVAKIKVITEEEPQERSLGGETGRQLGMTARHLTSGLMQTFTGFADIIEPWLDLVVPGEMEPISGMVDPLLDKTGIFPKPENALERGVKTASEFLTPAGVELGAAKAATRGSQLVDDGVTQVLRKMTEGPTGQAAAATAGGTGLAVAQEKELSPGLQALVSIISASVPGFGGAAGKKALQKTLLGSGEQARENIRTVEGAGLTPTVENVGSKTGGRVTKASEAFPGGGQHTKVRDANVDRMEQRVADVTEGGTSSQEVAGTRANQAAHEFIETRRAVAEGLYDDAGEYLDKNAIVELPTTRSTVVPSAKMQKDAPRSARRVQSDWVRDLGTDLEDDIADLIKKNGGGVEGLPYHAVRRLRSAVGERLRDVGLTTDASNAELKRIYGALSEDLKLHAQAQGPEAAQAASRADTYYKAFMDRVERLEKIVDKAGGAETVYKSLFSSAKDGGTKLRTMYRSMSPEDRDFMSKSFIRRMGEMTPGRATSDQAFSPETFLTNWNRVSPEGKSIITGGNQQFAEDLDFLTQAAGRLREGAQAGANLSGSGNRVADASSLMLTAYAAGDALFQQDPGLMFMAIAGGLSNKAAASAMSSPKFVHWLARAVQAPPGSEMAAVRELTQIAEETGDVGVMEFLIDVYEVAGSGFEDDPVKVRIIEE